jgi:hypothetical protein
MNQEPTVARSAHPAFGDQMLRNVRSIRHSAMSTIRPARPRMSAHLGRLPAVLAATALLAACSSPSAPPTPELTEVRTASVDTMTALGHSPSDMEVRNFHDRGLSGPHYTLGISWIATGQELHGTDADKFGVQPVRAPGGKQLVIVAVSPTATSTRFPPGTPVRVDAVVDGASTPLSGLPLAENPASQPMAEKTELVLLSATRQASMKLRVTDDGQTQELDLRTGTASGHGYQQRDTKIDWKGESPAVLPPPLNVAPVTLALKNPTVLTTSQQYLGATDHAYLTNYQNSGWAAPGQAFLTVPMPSLDCPAFCSPYHMTFDDATAFTFAPTGGKPIPAPPTARDMPLGFVLNTSPAPANIIFTVPDNVTDGTVTFDLAKSRLVSNDGKNTPWTKAPHAYTVKLTFTQ